MGLTPPTPAPYDTLAMVTAYVRTILADYIAGIDPAPQGTGNVTGTTTLTWVSGPKFDIYFVGAEIQVGLQANTVAAVPSPTTLILANATTNAAGVAWSATIPTGDIFADSQAYVVPTVNLGWRKLQKKLDTDSHPRLRGEVIIPSLPVAASADPAAQQWIDWTGFFDGVTKKATPALPQDFLSPLRLYERQSVPAGVNPNDFQPMHPVSDGLPSCDHSSYNRWWDYHDDKIFMVGAILPTDWRVQYQKFFADLVPAAGGFGATPIPIMRSAEALGYYTASAFVEARGGTLSATWDARGDDATDPLTNRQAKLQQRENTRRRSVYNSSRPTYTRYR